MKKEFIEIKIFLTPINEELISGYLDILDVKGIVIEDIALMAYFEEFNKDKEEGLVQFLEKLKNELIIENFSISKDTVQKKNWNEEWEKSIKPIKVSDKFVIKPSWHNYEKTGDEIVLTIDPKMSFGTGYHQTTRIMMRLIERYIPDIKRVCDIGTGTGVLGIAAIKLGAEYALLVDYDDVCEENVVENCEMNFIENYRFLLGQTSDIEENGFEMVLANIQRNVLLDIAADISKITALNGILLLSGLLIEDETIIVEKYHSQHFQFIEKISEDEWIGLVFKKI